MDTESVKAGIVHIAVVGVDPQFHNMERPGILGLYGNEKIT